MHTHIYSFNNKCLCIAYYMPNTVLSLICWGNSNKYGVYIDNTKLNFTMCHAG